MNDDSVPRALVMGESLVDVVERHGSPRAVHAGGSPLNVAFGLARLGIHVTFATEYGADPHGSLIADHLHSAGVDTLNTSHGNPTSTATARIDPEGAAHYDFSLDWDFAPTALPPAELVHTGSIGALREPGATAVRRHVNALGDDTLVTFDPNVRPSLMPDREQTLKSVDWYSRHAHLVKLSDEDAHWLFPGWTHRTVLDWILDRGAGIAVLTRGGDGSLLRSRAAEIEIEASAAHVVDTIGAGDAYMAGLLAGLMGAEPRGQLQRGNVSDIVLRSIGELASRVAALTVARAGAMPPTLDEIQALQTVPAARGGS
ncbi:carbohydrate kinase [Leifsonia sp. fls2-241-R2A-40a]|uniref:carbohydrate kinase family protein n=1 Tax=Leifsonia sp. fls2-241-R2A-40a TaxID=3040290 RepID=UPI00254E9D6F|nr:carbohydrate kinase [Leifsonia sp. fls2-241-R2A-40a]